jgi:hypothetical protein
VSLELGFDDLRDTQNRVSDAATHIADSLTAFHDKLAAYGAPWGNDELGSVIGEIYQGALAMTLDCYQSNLDAMNDYADLLDEVADGMQDGSSAAAARLNALIRDA